MTLARNIALIAAAVFIAAGVALWSFPAALIMAGILIGAFVLLTD